MEDSGVWRMSYLDMGRDISMDLNKGREEVYGLVSCLCVANSKGLRC